MSEIMKVIRERSSTRAYESTKLTKEQIDILIEAALLAPTAANMQEVHFTVIDTDNSIVKEIADDLNKEAKVPFYYNAPTLIIVSGKEDISWSAIDSGIAVENMHLAATGLGLGSVIIGCIAGILTGEKKAYYNEKLNIPDGFDFKIALAVGVPAATKAPHTYDCEKSVSIIL